MPVATSKTQVRLADHVRACLCDDQLIFLDLRRGKYVGVGGPRLRPLTDLIFGSVSGAIDPPLPLQHAGSDNWIDSLIDQQLLTQAPSVRKPRGPRLLEAVAALDPDDGRDNQSDLPRIVRLWRASLVTSTWLRRRSLADIESRVIALRTRHSTRDRSLDERAMRAAAGAYMRLRLFALSSHDRCLNDSLALVHFLATQGLFPQWVIGVRVHPFCAHSWVQHAGIVLNDQPEHVRAYQPILIV
jgi:hypothetical protein